MAIQLSDAGQHKHLLPLTYTRPVGELRAGILTIADAWRRLVDMPVGYRTEAYLQGKFPAVVADRIFEVHGGLLPNGAIAAAVVDLEPGQVLLKAGKPLAFCFEGAANAAEMDWMVPPAFLTQVECQVDVLVVERPWHLFQYCGTAIANDFALLTEGRRSAPISALNMVIGDPGLIFLEEGAKVEASILNTTNGPIWVGKGAEVMEGLDRAEAMWLRAQEKLEAAA